MHLQCSTLTHSITDIQVATIMSKVSINAGLDIPTMYSYSYNCKKPRDKHIQCAAMIQTHLGHAR